MLSLMQMPAGSVPIERPCLYLVATPIGNLSDVTLRALAVLAQSDLLWAEDTRTTRRLLDQFGIARSVAAVHEHNERELAVGLIARVAAEGLAAALVSDAGTPLVSDPGYRLVQAALAAGVPVRAVPGASALLAALCVSGLPSDRFAFEGFLPAREQAARSVLAALADEARTLIFYEAPRRIARTLELVADVMGAAREVAVARELTKLHETVYRGDVAQVRAALANDAYGEAGEFVLLVAPAPARTAGVDRLVRLLGELAPHMSRSRAVEIASDCLDWPRNEVYRIALSLEGFAGGGLG
jgi:16S rRNA (cytidine1402-2'-O)-methyltransferase